MAVPSGVDPHEVLGVAPGTPPDAVTAAYRRLAKRWHPDRASVGDAADRMALVNAAYAALRIPTGDVPRDEASSAPPPTGAPPVVDALAPAVRRALGAELRAALLPGEQVGLVVPAATWASPQTTLVVTDRRVLWLLDDAPVHRVRSLPLADVAAVAVRAPRPWRPRAQVVCTDRRGRRTTFGELPPETAAAVARRVGARGAGA